MRVKNQRRQMMKLLLFILLVSISMGYALLRTNLTINGTSKIKGNTWDIHFDNLVVSSGSVGLSTGDAAAAIGSNTTEVSYTVTLSQPGDFYEFTVDAVNAGSIDGMVESVTSKLNDTVITILPAYLDYSVSYSDGVEILPNQYLKAGETETYKVRIEFKKDISSSDLPTSVQTLTLDFGVAYIQADNTATEVEHGFTGIKYTANVYDKNQETSLAGTNNTMVWIGRTITDNITQYSSASEALAALKLASGNVDRPFYLKHKIENDIVTESYVEFVVTEAMAEANAGMVPGTYTLRGAGGTNCVYDANYKWTCDEYSPYYEANKEVLKTAFGYTTDSSRCGESGQASDGSLDFSCYVPGLIANSYLDGYVLVDDGSRYCEVYPDGPSGCNGY